MNTVLLQGNLSRDPEIRYIPTGDAVCSFSIAINEEYTNKKGEKCQTTTFVDCKAWRGMAEKVSEYKKGTAAVVMGKLRTDSWDDKTTNQKRYKTYVLAEVVTSPFAGGRPRADNPPPAARGSTPTQPELDDNVPY